MVSSLLDVADAFRHEAAFFRRDGERDGTKSCDTMRSRTGGGDEGERGVPPERSVLASLIARWGFSGTAASEFRTRILAGEAAAAVLEKADRTSSGVRSAFLAVYVGAEFFRGRFPCTSVIGSNSEDRPRCARCPRDLPRVRLAGHGAGLRGGVPIARPPPQRMAPSAALESAQ